MAKLKSSEREAMLKEIADQTRKLAEPVDLDELEKKGIIEKSGAWYIVHDMSAVPESAQARISQMSHKPGQLKVKFRKASEFDKLAKKMKKLGW